MTKRMQAARVKDAIREIISKQGKNAISMEAIAQKLRDEHSDAIEADNEDLLAYGLGVAIGRVSSRPVQDPVVKDLFGIHSHEYVTLRGASGGKVHLDYLTPRLLLNQPNRPQKIVDEQKSQEEILYEAAKEMNENGLSEDMPIIEYLKSK